MKCLIILILSILGVCFVIDGLQRTADARSQRVLNPLELKASPYGEIVGAALQDPVSIISHGGIGHQHVGEGEECETCGVSHGGGAVESRPKMIELKFGLRKFGSDVRQNNIPGKRSVEVRAYERAKIRELMTLAYEMDPSNHGNYSVYSDFVAEKGGFEARYAIALNTLQACEGRVNDPSDTLTAAVAAEAILIYRSIEMDRKGVENTYLESDYQLFEQKILLFRSSFERAEADGRLAKFSQEKGDEMLAVFSRLSWAVRVYKEKIDAAAQ